MKLLFASQNLGKINEVFSIIAHPDIKLISLNDLSQVIDEPEETGSTFKDNALLKAKYYAVEAGLNTLADDSGLVVSAMNGGPGVNSNRWHPGSDADRNQALLNFLQDYDDRSAKFVTVACYYNLKEDSHRFFRGEIEGQIANFPSGTEGFGYDPIFVPTDYQQSFAELGMNIKNELSHRARAYKSFMKYIVEEISK